MAFNFYIPGADPNYYDDQEEDPSSSTSYDDSGNYSPYFGKSSNFDWGSIGDTMPAPSMPTTNTFDFASAGTRPGAFDISSISPTRNRSSNLLGNVASAVGNVSKDRTARGNVNPDNGMDDPNSIYGQYRRAIMDAPTPDDYSPSKLRRVGAAAAGIGAALATKNPLLGMNISENVTNQPYKRAMDNWEARVGKLKLAADEERQTSQNRFNQRVKTAELGNAATEQERKVLDTLSLIENRESTTGLNKARTKQIQNDLLNPDVTLVKTDDGQLTAISKKGQVIKQYGKVNMSNKEVEAFKSGLQLRNQLANTAAQGSNQLSLEDERAKNASALEDQRAGNQRTLKAVPPATSGTGISQTEFNKRSQKAIADIMRRPEVFQANGWDKFFTKDSTGQTIPNEEEISKDPNQWQRFQAAVDKMMKANADRYRRGY